MNHDPRAVVTQVPNAHGAAPAAVGARPTAASRKTPAMSSWNRFASLYNLQLPLERRGLQIAADLASPAAHERLLDLAPELVAFCAF